MQIVLNLLLCFAEQGVSAEFDESVHISLLSCFERLAGWATSVPPQIRNDLLSHIWQFADDSQVICRIKLCEFVDHVAFMNSLQSCRRKIELISRILVTSDSRELSKLFRNKTIENVFMLQDASNVIASRVCPLLERLTRSSQFRSLVTETLSLHLMETLWSVWTEKQGPYLLMQTTSL